MPQVLLLAHGADPKLREMDGISALSCAMNNGDHLVEVIGGAAAIRAHYLASGSAEWPIPAPAAPPAAEEQLAAEEEECGCCVGVEHRPMNFGKPRPDFAARMSRVRTSTPRQSTHRESSSRCQTPRPARMCAMLTSRVTLAGSATQRPTLGTSGSAPISWECRRPCLSRRTSRSCAT
jgi:hypothetical protein